MAVSISVVIAFNGDLRTVARLYAGGFSSSIKSNSTTLAIGRMDLELIEDKNRQLTSAVPFMMHLAPGQENQLRRLWKHLVAGGEAISGGATLIPPTGYNFSPLFGWLAGGSKAGWQLVVDPSPGKAENTGAVAETANPTVIPYLTWTNDESQTTAVTEVYSQLFGLGNLMTLGSLGVHRFILSNSMAMYISSDSAKETENTYQVLGLTDAGVVEGTDTVVKPGVQPQPDRFSVYWTLQRYLRVGAIVVPTTKARNTIPIESHIIFEEPPSSFSSVTFGFYRLLVKVSLLGDLYTACCDPRR